MTFQVLQGDARQRLHDIADSSIQTTVTSPPYFGLRKYSDGDRDEIGNEIKIDQYVNNLVEVFELLLTKTRADGTLFLNLGDSYYKGALAGVPWRVALALSEVGWILRSDIIWRKPNAMPSAVKNRPTVEHEYVFMFAKAKNYYYDQDSIREPHVTFSEQSKMKGGRNHLGKRNGTPE